MWWQSVLKFIAHSVPRGSCTLDIFNIFYSLQYICQVLCENIVDVKKQFALWFWELQWQTCAQTPCLFMCTKCIVNVVCARLPGHNYDEQSSSSLNISFFAICLIIPWNHSNHHIRNQRPKQYNRAWRNLMPYVVCLKGCPIHSLCC